MASETKPPPLVIVKVMFDDDAYELIEEIAALAIMAWAVQARGQGLAIASLDQTRKVCRQARLISDSGQGAETNELDLEILKEVSMFSSMTKARKQTKH